MAIDGRWGRGIGTVVAAAGLAACSSVLGVDWDGAHLVSPDSSDAASTGDVAPTGDAPSTGDTSLDTSSTSDASSGSSSGGGGDSGSGDVSTMADTSTDVGSGGGTDSGVVAEGGDAGCTPGTVRCDGLVPQRCPAGSWVSGAPCTTTCNAGSCGVCSPGAMQCAGLQPQTCDSTGSWEDSGAACPAFCNAGSCAACSAGEVRCNGNQPQSCDASGAWQDSSAACSGQTCVSGACTGVCGPGQTLPVACGDCGTDTQTCSATGTWQSSGTCSNQGVCSPGAKQACNTYGTESCSASCGWGACSCAASPVCTPNATQCSGSNVQTCDACGQWGTPVACAAGMTCSGSGCVSPTGASGEIYFEECGIPEFCGGAPYLELEAGFVNVNPSSCTPSITSGACAYFPNCQPGAPGYVSAGILDISGGTLPVGTPVDPNTNEQYLYTSSTYSFGGGQTLSVMNTGATVPAFGMESLVSPTPMSLTKPTSTTGTFALATSGPLTVTWSGGQTGAQVQIEGASTTTSALFVCTWDGGAGGGTVPQAMLAGLAGQSGYLYFSQSVGKTFSAGSYTVDFAVMNFGMGTATFH